MKEIQLESQVINPNTENKSEPVTKQPGIRKEFFIKTLINKFKQLPTKKKIIYGGLSLVFFVLVAGGLIYYSIISERNLSQLELPELLTALFSDSLDFDTINHQNPDEPRSIESPINGKLFTRSEWEELSKKHPIAVMIENHVDARNQSGYNSAEIVHEALAEGGITRTVALFWSEDAEAIGPIRSARQYFIEWILPYNPYYMFIGYASGDPSDYDRRVDAQRSISEYGMLRLDSGGSFWRINTKAAPHNAYSSTAKLYQIGEIKGYDDDKPKEVEPLKFKNDDPLEDRGTSTTATIQFFKKLGNGGLYDIIWKYDRDLNVYLRYNGTTPYLDANTGEQVYAKNVVIMRNTMISTYDFAAHIIIETIGEGDATLLRDGQVINCTWKKKDKDSRVHLYTSEGDELELNRGIIWYESVPTEQGTAHIES